MTPQEFSIILDERLAQLHEGNGLCINGVHGMMMRRIFEDGKKADGSDIGQYNDSTEIWADTKRGQYPVSLQPKGKKREAKVTTYFESYKDLRSKMGRETGNVNLVLTGRLQTDMGTSLQPDGDRWIVGVNSDENSKKIEGIEKRYGDNIFMISNDEKQALIECIQTSSVRKLSGND